MALTRNFVQSLLRLTPLEWAALIATGAAGAAVLAAFLDWAQYR